jgi:hypothetical protein
MPIADDLRPLFARWSELARTNTPGGDEDLLKSLRLFAGESSQAAAPTLGVRQRNWLRNVTALHAFVHDRGRWPHRIWRQDTSGADAGEEHLVNWLREQRRHDRSHCAYQRERLEAIPGFEWSPRDEAWDRHVDGYRAFVNEHGRRPRGSSQDRTERKLAVWASNQRTAQRKGRLPKHREDELSKLT